MDQSSHHPIEHPPRFSRRKRSLSTVVPNPVYLIEKQTSARIVRIRLVFVQIGKKKTYFIKL